MKSIWREERPNDGPDRQKGREEEASGALRRGDQTL